MLLNKNYGKLALVAGASEGIGAAFASYLAASGMDLVLIARRKNPLENLATSLSGKFKVEVMTVCCDLSETAASHTVKELTVGKEIDILIYNAALSHIGPFENTGTDFNSKIAFTNMITPMNLIKLYGDAMLQRNRGAIILMASLAGFQGSGYLAAYAATKSFNIVLAESLWYEWKSRGVDIMACCAGATSTDNYIKTNPAKNGFFAPVITTPENVVSECFEKLGTRPSFIPGRGNRIANFIMQRILSRKMAINIIGDNTKRIYRL
jgi:short-subunit dehydrogenase